MLPEPVIEEFKRVLSEKLSFSSDRAEDAIGLVSDAASEILPAPESVEPLSGDPDDDRILACAIEANADILVSGDRRHLVPLKKVGDLRVVTPQALLAELT